MKANLQQRVLHLIDPFGIARDTTTTRTTVLLEFEGGGRGEAAAVGYNKQTPEGESAALQAMIAELPEDLADLEGILGWMRHRHPGHAAALCALDLALHDRLTLQLNVPLYRWFGCAPPRTQTTSFTIGIDTEEVMLRKVEKAAKYPVLKIKLGRDVEHDMRVMKAIRRAAPGKTIRVDANAGWTLEQARQCIPLLADLGVEYVEQPLAIGAFDQMAILKKESPLPLFVDEDSQVARDLPRLAGACHGINIKLMKCGGLLEARKMIAVARAMDLQIMLGCMIETSLAITAAAHLASLVDHLDLDGALLTADDPFDGMILEGPEQYVRVPENRPGIGAIPRSA